VHREEDVQDALGEGAARAKKRADSEGTLNTPNKPAKRPQWEIDRERDEKAREQWAAIAPAVMEAVVARVSKLPAKATGLLADVLVWELGPTDDPPVGIKRGNSAEDLVRYLAAAVLCAEVTRTWTAPRDFPKRAKALGIDLQKIRAHASSLEEFADKASQAATDYLTFVSEADALLRGAPKAFLRRNFDAWAQDGHAKKIGRVKYYRAIMLPRRTPESIAREAGRQGERAH
jgi:hypothetical protein